MGQEPEELKADIAQRRESMTATIDAIEDRVVPGRIIERRRRAVRAWGGGVRDRVMGPPRAVKDQAAAAASHLGEGVSEATSKISDAPAQLGRATTGSPLMAGAVAFGIGALIAALVPETESERKAVQTVQPQLEAATDALKEAGEHALEAAKTSTQEAAVDLKASASEHAQEVADQAKDAGQQLQDTTREATQSQAGA